MQISLPPCLSSVPSAMAEGSPATFPPCRALCPGLTLKLCVFQEGKAMFCASQSVCSPVSCVRMGPWAHISPNELQELREVVDFIISPDGHCGQTGTSKWQFTSSRRTQSADGSSQLQLLTNIPQVRWCDFSQRFSVLVAKISPYPIKRQRCTIFCLCSVSFCYKKLFSTYQSKQN